MSAATGDRVRQVGVTLAESQRDHAAIRRADDGPQRTDAEMIEQPAQQLGLVVAGYAGKVLAVPGTGGLATASEVVERQHA